MTGYETPRHDGEENRDERPKISNETTQHEQSVTDTPKKRTPLPKFQLALVLAIQFAEPITGVVIYPFVNQLVRRIGVTKGDDRKTGYYAGIIESVFFFAEAATVFQWGWLSDKIGRRPVLLLGPLGLTFAMLRFGYSTTFLSLVVSRCMQGVFNGNIGVSKTVMAELADETNIGDVFAMMPLVWSTGSTVGPIIGGVLSNPATRWPHIFGKINFFKTHPYFLPCLASACIAFFSFIIAFLGFKETLRRPDNVHNVHKQLNTVQDGRTQSSSSVDTLLENGDGASYGTLTSTRCASPNSDASSTHSSQRHLKKPETSSLSSILRSKTLQTIVINYVFLCFTDMCYSVLMPLIYSTKPELGGLGLSPYAIGLIMGIWGFLNAFVQINLLGRLIRRYSATRVYKTAYACLIVCFSTYPVSIYFARRDGGVGLGTSISMLVQLTFQFAMYMCYGAIHVTIVETTPKTVLGSVNGLVQMAGSIMRTTAPTFASSLFSISLEKNLAGGYFVFIVMICVVIGGIRCSLGLPEHHQQSAR